MGKPRLSNWDCDAYGPGSHAIGALCFFSGELGARVCTSPAACCDRMASERQRVWQRIQDMAAAGDPVGVDLAAAFPDPEMLLGGGGES